MASKAARLARLNAQIRRIKCRGQKYPAVHGEGPANAKIVIVGEAPGRQEMLRGRPFVGMAGKFLDRELKKFGIERKKIYILGTAKCMPPRGGRPSQKEIDFWLPYTKKQLELIRPKLVVLMGDVAIKAFLGSSWSVSSCHGEVEEREGYKFLVMPHPAAAMRFPKIRKIFESDMKIFKRFYEQFY